MKNKKLKKLVKTTSFPEWLDRNIKILVDLYGIGSVTIMINDNSTHAVSGKRGGDVLFRINYSMPYKTANIWYYRQTVDLYKKRKFAVLRQALTHEIAHIVTNPLATLACDRYIGKQQVDDCVENLTETIGQICRKLLDAKKIEMM